MPSMSLFMKRDNQEESVFEMFQSLQKNSEVANNLHQINQTMAPRLSHETTLYFKEMEEKGHITLSLLIFVLVRENFNICPTRMV